MSEVGKVAAESFEARIVKLEGERDARLTIDEARTRLLDAMENARQGAVSASLTGIGIDFGDLLGSDAAERERRIGEGRVVQVVALNDFNAAVDRAFPDSDQSSGSGEGQ